MTEKPRTLGIIKEHFTDTRTEFFDVHKNGMNGIPWDKCKLIMKS
jgi:hypothetical protein